MILPDVNVLLYALRPDASHHNVSRTWLTSVINGHAPFGISPLSLAAVCRIGITKGVYTNPSTHQEVFAFSEYLLQQPHCQIVEPGPRHWDIFKRLCVEASITGPRVTDAWYAALAIEADCEWITFDRDYARFNTLKWRQPA